MRALGKEAIAMKESINQSMSNSWVFVGRWHRLCKKTKITPVYNSVQKMYWKKFRPNCRTWEPYWQENWQNGAKSNREMLKLLDFVRKKFRIIWRAKLPAVIETKIIYSQGKGTQSLGTKTATSCCLELQAFCHFLRWAALPSPLIPFKTSLISMNSRLLLSEIL